MFAVLSKLQRSIWQNDQKYKRVDRFDNASEKDQAGSKQSLRHVKPVIIALTFLLAIYVFLTSRHAPAKPVVSLKQALPPAYLRMVYPARHADVNLCKTILSAAILHYPEPMLIGFKGRLDHLESSHTNFDLTQRIALKTTVLGIDNHLRNISASRDDDLVIIADGLNTWFQLRPQTLVDRYFESIRNADESIKKEFGKNADILGIRQTIMFGSQRDCSPWSPDDPACSAVPESTLPSGIYGPHTDAAAGERQDLFTKRRPKYINPGFAMGPLGPMRKLYAEAARRVLGNETLQDDAKVLGLMFVEQEMAREPHKLKYVSITSRLSAWFSSFWDSAIVVADKQAQLLREANLSHEFGIGLDYASGLAFEIAHAENDVEFLKFGDMASLHMLNAKHDISDSRIGKLASDIAASLPPFWTFSKEILPPRSTPWSNVSLLTNVWTGVTPAVIQHDLRNYHSGSLRESWWSSLWYHKYARRMYDFHVQSPFGAIAISGYNASSRRQYWSLEDWKGGARNETKWWWRYEDLCGGTEHEVFRDKKGSWYLPPNHM